MHFRQLFRSLAMAALLLLQFAPAIAQDQKGSLTGTWKLISITSEKDGKVAEPWGASPHGILVLDPTGRFSQIQMRSDRPKYASNNRLKGTDEENKATAQGVLAYYGTYTADEKNGVLAFSIEASSFPNQNGTANKRPFVIEGSDLVTINPAPAGGSEIKLRWRKM
jgi:hypothetical protein